MGLTKAQLEALSDSSFPNNNSGYITPAILRDYNDAVIGNTVNQDVYSTDSASFDNRIDSLESWSSSLDTTYATDAQLNASSSTLQSNINTLSSSVFQTDSTQSNNIASISSSVGLLQTFSGSQYKADSSSFDNRITNVIIGSGLVTTSSFNAYTQSTNTYTASQNLLNARFAITGSNTFSGSQIINGFLQANTLYVTGSITASSYSGSVEGIGNVTLYSASVDSRLDLVEVSSSINSQSAWGSFQSASSYSASLSSTITSVSSSSATTYAQLGVANNFTANQTITGSAKGRVSALTAVSSTASIDCSSGNFFTFAIPTATTTLMNPTNVQAGQTISIRMTQPATTGSVRWPSNVKYNTAGAPFTGSAVGGAVDVVTFVTFDTTTLYLAGIKNLA
jgi:hypothetical protein